MKKGERYLLGGLLIILGGILGWNSISMTGNVIGGVDNGIGSILGIALIIGGMLVCMSGASGLERKTWDEFQQNLPIVLSEKSGEIYIRSALLKNTLKSNGAYGATDTFKDVRERLSEMAELNPAFQKAFQTAFINDLTIAGLRKQRNESSEYPLVEGSLAYQADQFLKEWDPAYDEVVHPTLRPPPVLSVYPNTGFLDHHARVQGAGNAVRLMKENIPGVSSSGRVGHDYPMKYNGHNIGRIDAGNNDETTTHEIDQRLRKIAEKDIDNDENLTSADLNQRVTVLRRAIYGDNM